MRAEVNSRCNYSATDISPLSFSPVGEMQVTLAYGEAIGYQTNESIFPSPTGEVRWGLKSIARVTLHTDGNLVSG